MAANASARDERIEIRTTKEEKRLLTAAAQERLDLTGFIMRSILPIARDAIDRSESIVVSDRDAQRVLDLLEPPPEPTPALVDAMRRRPRR